VSNPTPRTNKAMDFFSCVIDMVETGALVTGDVLVLDNARIHWAYAIQAPLINFLYLVGVQLMFLPTYSPELNPCEVTRSLSDHHSPRTRALTCVHIHNANDSTQLFTQLVFGDAKKWLWKYRGSRTFLAEVAIAFNQVTYSNVVGYYLKCVDPR
jgi:hypothetical protein